LRFEKRTIRSISLFCFYPLTLTHKTDSAKSQSSLPRRQTDLSPSAWTRTPSHFAKRGKSPNPSRNKLPSHLGRAGG
jgi:hypothetical protein